MLTAVSMEGWGILPNLLQITKSVQRAWQSRRLAQTCSCLKEITMKLLGQIDRVRRNTFCFIKGPNGQEYRSHENDFLEPSIMVEKQMVRFDPVQIAIPGKLPEAKNVEAA
jgi:hypothetical protein